MLESGLGESEGCVEDYKSAPYRGGFGLEFKCLVSFRSLRNPIIFNLCEVEEFLGAGISQEVRKLVFRYDNADLLHSFRSQHSRSYPPKTVDDISVRSWLSSLSRRDLNVLLKTTLPSGSVATTPPRSSIGFSSITSFPPFGRTLDIPSRFLLLMSLNPILTTG